MAQRRGPGGAIGAGIGDSLSSLGETLQQLAMKRYEDQLLTKRQSVLSDQNNKEALITKAINDPIFARRLQASGLVDKLGLSIPQMTSAEAQRPMLDQITKADSEGKIPTQDEIVNSSRLNNQDAYTAGGQQIPIADTARMVLAARDRQSKFDQIEASKPITVPGVNDQGAETSTITTQGAAAGKTFQKGRTIPQEAKAAGATAGATTNAQQGALNSPINIKGAAARAGAIAGAEAPFRAGGQVNETDRSATQYYVRALSAANTASQLEKVGVSGAGAKYLPDPIKSSLQKRYTQTQDEFVSTIVYLQSGKQINQNEMDIYRKAYFAGPNDPPEVVRQKQEARARAIEGAKFIAKRGVDEYLKSGGKIPTLDTTGLTNPAQIYLDEQGNEIPGGK